MEQEPSRKISALVREVLSSFDDVQLRELKSMDQGLKSRVEKIINRCGSQSDCQEHIARLLNAQVLVLVRAKSIGDGVVANLHLKDMGSGYDLLKVSRTMTGSNEHKKNVLNEIITGVLFPEKLIGRIELKIEPVGADIYLDGQLKVSGSPGSVNLESVRAGRHTLSIKHEGYRDFIAIIQVPFNGVSQLNARMQKIPASKN